MIEAIQAIKFEGKNFRSVSVPGEASAASVCLKTTEWSGAVSDLCPLLTHACRNRELAEQSKKHGNDLFGWGKKNPAQYYNCLKSYTVRAARWVHACMQKSRPPAV